MADDDIIIYNDTDSGTSMSKKAGEASKKKRE